MDIYKNEENRYWEGSVIKGYNSRTTSFTYFESSIEALKEKVNDLG